MRIYYVTSLRHKCNLLWNVRTYGIKKDVNRVLRKIQR